MVVFRHSLNYYAFFGHDGQPAAWNSWIQGSMMHLTQVAVPFFFIVSGYFFFRKTGYSRHEYMAMLKKKWETLALPYLFWNATGMLTLMATGQFERTTPLACLIKLINNEYYGPLWYVKDLIVFMTVCPLIFMIRWDKLTSRAKQTIIVTALCCLWYCWIPVDTRLCSTEGVFFFFVGGIIQHSKIALTDKNKKRLLYICMPLWIGISLADLPLWQMAWLNKVCIVTGITTVWLIYDLMPYKLTKQVMNVSSFSFFLYVTHFYVIKIMKLGTAALFFNNNTASALSYLIMPLATSAICVVIGICVKKIFPRLYGLTTGGR